MNIKKKRILVIGLGLSGRASAEFLMKRGAKVVGVDGQLDHLDSRSELERLKMLGMHAVDAQVPQDLRRFDLVVVSPGVPQTDRHYQDAINAGVEVIGEMELACRFITKKVIAVTGTNGKTTTTLLTEHVLNSCGKKARALGNIGIPLIKEIDNEEWNENEILVLEISSFQLETLQQPIIDAGVILNITPDHLDRYSSMDEYALAKIRIKECLKTNGKLIVEENCYKDHYLSFGSMPVWTFGFSPKSTLYCNDESVFLQGRKVWDLPPQYKGTTCHDIENWMGSFALCSELGISGMEFLQAALTFKKPSHRMEFVRTVNGIEYYDDSKGTNIDAVIKAVRSLKKKIILIAGGVDKGAPYTPWIAEFDRKVLKIFAIGESAVKINADLAQTIPVEICKTLQEAAEKSIAEARQGQIVLLSPGCASFDQFRDYAHRGEEFKKIVNSL